MTAKDFLKYKGYYDSDYMDEGMINHISEMMEEYHVHNKVHVCRCKQCKASKQKTHRNAKKLVKRMLNKKRRQLTSNPKHFIHMWA